MTPKKDDEKKKDEEEKKDRFSQVQDLYAHCPCCGQKYLIEDGHDCVAASVAREEE